jgi:Glycosyl hydrolase family 30 beta sandwich domain
MSCGNKHHWCRSITAWNFALDERGRPNIGPFSCGGLVTINSQTREITRSGQYWAFAHLARNIHRRARQFDSTSTADLGHVTFLNPDGSRVLIVTNSGPARTLTVRTGTMQAEMPLGLTHSTPGCGMLEPPNRGAFEWSGFPGLLPYSNQPPAPATLKSVYNRSSFLPFRRVSPWTEPLGY